jgi:hypothetical protein
MSLRNLLPRSRNKSLLNLSLLEDLLKCNLNLHSRLIGSDMQTPVSPASPSTHTSLTETTPSNPENEQDIQQDTVEDEPPVENPIPTTLEVNGTPAKQFTTPPQHITTTITTPAKPEHPSSARRTPSKVPGDYDPVSGYYRRKSDADTRSDSDGI